MNFVRDVADFLKKFGIPTPAKPEFMSEDVHKFRRDFLFEELNEFDEAYASRDLAKAADALVDLVYVAIGNAIFMGLPFDKLWAEVQRANMQKVRATSSEDSRSTRKHSYDVVKPEGWQPPDIQRILDEANT